MHLQTKFLPIAALLGAALFAAADAGAQTSMPVTGVNIMQYSSYTYNPQLDPRRDVAVNYPTSPPPTQSAPPMTSGGIGQLPGYSYDPQYDTTRAPPIGYPEGSRKPNVSPAPTPPYMGLATRSGLEPYLQVFDYRYHEPGLGVTLSGASFGLGGKGTIAVNNWFFATADLRYAIGWLDYSGSGTQSGNLNETIEARGYLGRDFIFQQFSLSPYVGIGYRHLYDDNRGTTSTGAQGYQRKNDLYYLPIGIQPRTHIDSNSRLSASFEYDVFLHGTQESDLKDTGFGDPNIKNSQHGGYGLRSEIMYERRTWAIGPFFNYWNINTSSPTAFASPLSTCGGPNCIGTEPSNHTLEAGLQFRYHFF